MRISVCDDDSAILDYFRELFKQECFSSDTVDCFTCATEQIEACRVNNYDLAFIDIEMPDQNGLDAARQVKSLCPDSEIVFITAYILEYVNDIFYGVRPYGFIAKPITDRRIKYYIEKRRGDMSEQTRTLTVSRAGQPIELRMSAIWCIESSGKKLSIRRSDDTVEVYEKLDSIEKRLDQRFLRCHKSFIVNMDYVVDFGGGTLVLKNGEAISISRTRMAEAKQKYFNYKGRVIL